MLDWIKTIWEYNYWAHHKMLDCVAHLSDEDFRRDVAYSIGSVQQQVVHVMWAENLWYARIQGTPFTELHAKDYPTPAAVRAKWSEVEAEWRAYLGRLTEADLDTTFQYTRSDGETITSLLSEILGHVVNHGTDHRAQILHLCYGYGAPTFEQDMFFYFRARDRGEF
jgi:uncharacterized damage-inducible protein DinB